MRVEEFERLDMDVAVGDHDQWPLTGFVPADAQGVWFRQQLRAKELELSF
jgi:hypothetical protein